MLLNSECRMSPLFDPADELAKEGYPCNPELQILADFQVRQIVPLFGVFATHKIKIKEVCSNRFDAGRHGEAK